MTTSPRSAAVAAPARTVRVHSAEVSTDPDALLGYAETIALLVTFVALVAAAWFVATPEVTADFTQPAPQVATVASFERAPEATDDVVAPHADSGARSTSVELPAPAIAAPAVR